MPGAVMRAAALVACACAWAAGVQAQTTSALLVGAARDAARARLVEPLLFDPLLTDPIVASPQAVLDLHGDDLFALAHAAVRNGDDSYGIRVAAPLHRGADPRSTADVLGLRPHASLGIDLTNIIWRPRVDGTTVSFPWAAVFHANYQFNRADYLVRDRATGTDRADTRLNDTATVVGGLQFLARRDDPGVFVSVAYVYSAVFQPSPAVAGVIVDGPSKRRANLVRTHARRVWPHRGIGVSASYAYDASSPSRITEVIGDWRGRCPWYAGARVGYDTLGAQPYASVFVGIAARR